MTIVARASSDGDMGRLSNIGVSTSPGITTLARMPVFLSSVFRNAVKFITAALAALYAIPASRLAVTPAIDDTLIIVPSLRSTICGTTAWEQYTDPATLESITARSSSGVVVSSRL